MAWVLLCRLPLVLLRVDILAAAAVHVFFIFASAPLYALFNTFACRHSTRAICPSVDGRAYIQSYEAPAWLLTAAFWSLLFVGILALF